MQAGTCWFKKDPVLFRKSNHWYVLCTTPWFPLLFSPLIFSVCLPLWACLCSACLLVVSGAGALCHLRYLPHDHQSIWWSIFSNLASKTACLWLKPFSSWPRSHIKDMIHSVYLLKEVSKSLYSFIQRLFKQFVVLWSCSSSNISSFTIPEEGIESERGEALLSWLMREWNSFGSQRNLAPQLLSVPIISLRVSGNATCKLRFRLPKPRITKRNAWLLGGWKKHINIEFGGRKCCEEEAEILEWPMRMSSRHVLQNMKIRGLNNPQGQEVDSSGGKARVSLRNKNSLKVRTTMRERKGRSKKPWKQD